MLGEALVLAPGEGEGSRKVGGGYRVFCCGIASCGIAALSGATRAIKGAKSSHEIENFNRVREGEAGLLFEVFARQIVHFRKIGIAKGGTRGMEHARSEEGEGMLEGRHVKQILRRKRRPERLVPFAGGDATRRQPAVGQTSPGQTAARVMEETGGAFGGRGHAEFTHVNRVEGREVNAAPLADALEQRAARRDRKSAAGEQAAEECVGTARVDFGHRIDQKLRLRRVVRRILIDAKETNQTLDEVIERGAQIGAAVVVAPPAFEIEAVVLIFFKRSGVERAEDAIADFDGLDALTGLTGSAPVKSVDILQNGQQRSARRVCSGGLFVETLREASRQMLGSEMRFAEKHEEKRIRTRAANLGNLVGGMAVAGGDLPQIFARHAVQSVNRGLPVACGGEKFVEGGPIVSPIGIEANALAKFAFINFAALPFV